MAAGSDVVVDEEQVARLAHARKQLRRAEQAEDQARRGRQSAAAYMQEVQRQVREAVNSRLDSIDPDGAELPTGRV